MRPTNWELSIRDKKFREGFHWCSRCKEYLPLHLFGQRKTSRYGYNHWCIECTKVTRRGNKKVKERSRVYNKQLKSYYKQLMGGKCAKCGYSKSQSGLDFHHISPINKKHNLSKLISTNNHSLIIVELDKCTLLCKTCHQELTASCWSSEFIKATLGWIIKPNTIVEYEEEYWEFVPDKILIEQKALF